MAKISELPQATELTGSELLPVVVVNDDETKTNRATTIASLALIIKTLEELASTQFVNETVQTALEARGYATLTELARELSKKAEVLHEHTQYSEVTHTHDYVNIQNTPDLTGYALSEDFNTIANRLEEVDANSQANSINIETIMSLLDTLSTNEGQETESGHVHSNFSVLETITPTKIVAWDSKFDGDYNNLKNKPTIPTKLSDLEIDMEIGGGEGESESVIIHDTFITPEQFGAIGDGVANDTEAIQQCVEFCQLNKLPMLLNKIYLINNTITITKSLRLFSSGGGLNLGGVEWDTPVIKIGGTLGDSYSLTSDVVIGTSSLSIEHGLSALDWILLKSGKKCLSQEYPHYSLGVATGTTGGAYYGEFGQVASVAENSVTLFGNTVFPSYDSESVATKVNFVENVIVDGLAFYNGSVKSGGYYILLEYAKDCKIMNCVCNDAKIGNFITFLNCLNCIGDNNILKYIVKNYTNYYERNGFKILSSQKCVFDKCVAYNGSQPFDMTYSNGSIACSFCAFTNCKAIDAIYTCFTTHPGTYKCSILNCFGNSNGDGISIRGRGHIVSNNTLQGTSITDYGICLAEGGGFETVVSNNNIGGFGEGLRVNESYSTTRDCSYSTPLNSVFSGNIVSMFNLGIRIDKITNSTNSNATLGVSFIGNVFKDFVGANKYLIHVNGNANHTVKGIYFKNNFVNCVNSEVVNNGIVQSLFRFDANVESLHITNNSFINVSSSAYIVYGTTGGRTVKAYINNNGLSNPLSTNAGVESITIQTSAY